MKILIVGAGEIGRHLAISLSAQSHHITVLETDEQSAASLAEQMDGRVLVADGTSVDELVEAEAAEAELFFALTSDNNANLVAASVARKLGAKKTICRVHPNVQRLEWMFDYRQHFEIDYLFSSEKTVAVELAKHIRSSSSLTVEEIARGRIEFQQVEVATDSDAAGKLISELKMPPRLRIATVSRGDEHMIPNADTVLESDDVVTLFGDPRKLQELATSFGTGSPDDARPKRVVIFGGTDYGLMLAQVLRGWNCRIRIFESDVRRCEVLKAALPEKEVEVLHLDGTVLGELKEEQVGEADFFVATSESDEDNVMTCLQAHTLGVGSCLTLIHRADYADAIGRLGSRFGIDVAVSPRAAARRELNTFVTSDRYHVIRSLDAGELIEASISETSKMAGKKVSEIKWPKGAGLVALMHDVHAKVPAADDVIEVGDNVFAMVSRKAKRKFLRLL